MKKKLFVLMLIVTVSGTFLFLGRFFDQEITAAITESATGVGPSNENVVEQRTMEIVVWEGWTLAEIAEAVGMEPKKLMQLNNLTSPIAYPGQTLKVKPYTAFDEVWVSWYGPKYHGKAMASGKVFNMYDPTVCAHKWLPFGTRVRLTRIDTGATVELLVQDRGPYVANRHFDLSYAAAQQLHMIKKGVVLCKVEILDWPH